MKKPLLLTISVIILPAVLVLGVMLQAAYAGDGEKEKAGPEKIEEKIAIVKNILRSHSVAISVSETPRGEVIQMLSDMTGIDFELPAKVSKSMKKLLDEGVTITMRGAPPATILDFIFMGTEISYSVKNGKVQITLEGNDGKAEDETSGTEKTATPDSKKNEDVQKKEKEENEKTGRARVIMVVEYIKFQPVSYGVITGGSFAFKVKKVERFEKGDKKEPANDQMKKIRLIDFTELSKRNRKLDRYNRLEWSLEYHRHNPSSDSPAVITAMKKKLKAGEKYILAMPSASYATIMGRMAPGMWGSIMKTDIVVVDYSEEALKDIDKTFSSEYKPPKEKPEKEDRKEEDGEYEGSPPGSQPKGTPPGGLRRGSAPGRKFGS